MKNFINLIDISSQDLRKILAKETFLKWTINFHHKHNPSHNETGWFAKGEENWGTDKTILNSDFVFTKCGEKTKKWEDTRLCKYYYFENKLNRKEVYFLDEISNKLIKE